MDVITASLAASVPVNVGRSAAGVVTTVSSVGGVVEVLLSSILETNLIRVFTESDF